MSTISADAWVKERLHLVARHWRELIWMRGLGIVLIALALPLSLWLILDLFLNFPSGIRTLGLCVSGLSGLAAMYFALVRPLLQGITPRNLIDWLEAADPRLQERLLTSVELSNAREMPSRVGRLMQQQLRRETQRLLGEIDPVSVIPPDRAYRLLGMGLLMCGLCLAPFLIWMTGYGLGWQRLVIPSGNWGWGRNYRLEGKSPPPLVARGSDVPLVVTARPLRGGLPQPPSLTVHWRPTRVTQEQTALSAIWEQRRLVWSEAEQAYLSTLPRVIADTEYVITGAAAESPRYQFQVVEPPRLLSLSVSITPPAYTGLPSADQHVGHQLVVPAGSEIIWTAVFDRLVQQASLDWPQGISSSPQNVSFVAKSGKKSFTGRCRATTAGLFVMRWTSPEGFENADPPRQLTLRPDAPPLVKLEGPSSLSVHPQERHQLSITAGDDYGLTRAELWIEHSSTLKKVVPLTLQPDLHGRFQWSPVVDLADWKLESGQSLRLWARVVDNCAAPAPQEQWSESQVLVLNSQAPSAQTRELASQTQDIRQALQQLMRDVAQQRTDVRAVHQKTAAATVRQKEAAQEQRVTELEERQKELSATLDELRNKIPQTAVWDEIAQRAEKSRTTEFEQAERQLAQAQQSQPREQIEQLSRALDDLGTAQKNLQQLDDMVRSLANEGSQLDELARLANRSERLAEAVDSQRAAAAQPEEETAAPPVPTGELQTAAQQLNDEFDRLIERMTDLKQARESLRQQREQAARETFSRLAQDQRRLSQNIARTSEAEIPSALQPENTSRMENPPADATAADISPPAGAGSSFQAGQSLAMKARELANRIREQQPPLDGAGNHGTETIPRTDAQKTSSFDRLAEAIEQADFQTAMAQVPATREELTRLPMPAPKADSGNSSTEGTEEGEASIPEEFNRLAEQLAQAAQSSGLSQQRGALAAQQDRIEREARNAGQVVTATSGSSATSPPMGNPAPDGNLLDQAQRAMEDVRQSLAQEDSSRAESASEIAAQALERLSDQNPRQSSPGTPSASPLSRMGEQVERAEQGLSEGLRSLTQAQPGEQRPSDAVQSPSQSQRQSSPTQGPRAPDNPSTPQPVPEQPQQGGDQFARAAQEFRSAATALRKMAQSPSDIASTRPSPKPGTNTPSSSDPAASEQPNDGARMAAAASLEGAEGSTVVGSKRVWGRLTGTLQTDILDSTRLPSHPEYRRQIQHYFQEIARTVSQPVAPKPPEAQP